MFTIKSTALPGNTFLDSYRRHGAYTDCYVTEIPRAVTQAEFVIAFYSTPLFRLERFILKWVVSKPSTDADVIRLANAETDTFAAWRVENRGENQLLMCDYQNKTRSWLMTEAINSSNTRLYFGSAVVPGRNAMTGEPSFGFVFHSLIWFHKIYSVALLLSAKSRLIRQ